MIDGLNIYDKNEVLPKFGVVVLRRLKSGILTTMSGWTISQVASVKILRGYVSDSIRDKEGVMHVQKYM